MKGNEILLNCSNKGIRMEGIVSGTPSPGTVMEIVPAVAPVNGRHTWRATALATGAKQLPLVVLLEDNLQGKTATDAYVSGKICQLYVPLPGDELNMLVADVGGTAQAIAIGDLYGVKTVTGDLLPNSSYTSTPFKAMEKLAVVGGSPADRLVWFMVT